MASWWVPDLCKVSRTVAWVNAVKTREIARFCGKSLPRRGSDPWMKNRKLQFCPQLESWSVPNLCKVSRIVAWVNAVKMREFARFCGESLLGHGSEPRMKNPKL